MLSGLYLKLAEGSCATRAPARVIMSDANSSIHLRTMSGSEPPDGGRGGLPDDDAGSSVTVSSTGCARGEICFDPAAVEERTVNLKHGHLSKSYIRSMERPDTPWKGTCITSPTSTGPPLQNIKIFASTTGI
ncbi:hypothetical protein EW146_g9719 [Bondarzewia mesenterica]|uniref:Uncharacterized protein n=1 Tax=Bondarzewia mesenterica TaxID=1095465 RepID=A0A4V3XCJ6_9AGAM|nr:hypothetical protein EW146_g9719 [Bondarzewia mesenterica]